MGQTRTKVIETAVDTEKIKKVEAEVKNLSVKPDKEKTATKAKPPKQRSRRYKSANESVDKDRLYPTEEAVRIIKQAKSVGFDETIEAHINLNLAKDKSDQHIRLQLTLPHKVEKSKKDSDKKAKILVFSSTKTDEIKKLGAEIGTDTTIKQLESGKAEYDKIISDSSWMPALAKIAKVLGPKGLMPSPKTATVTEDPVSALKELAGGKMEIKNEKLPIIHGKIGKISFTEKQLLENFASLIEAVKAAKPEGLKKELIRSVYLSSTMGPSVKIDLSSL